MPINDQNNSLPTAAQHAITRLPSAPLASRLLCQVDFELDARGAVRIGRSPWRDRSIARITGGRVEGPALQGRVLPGGGDWSEVGEADGATLLAVDVRSVWETHDGALIHVAYTGRISIPAKVVRHFFSDTTGADLREDAYYFRIQPTFETSDARYSWLNHVVAIGFGRRTTEGVSYRLHAVE